METNHKCKFGLAWVGPCGQDADESGFCSKHKGVKCCSCGEQATHECSETMGLVCGADLCDNCEHTIESNGCNSGGRRPEGLGGHCRKDQQVYKPWYMRNEKEKLTEKMDNIKELLNDARKHGLEVEVVAEALKAMQEDPTLNIDDAMAMGFAEWVK